MHKTMRLISGIIPILLLMLMLTSYDSPSIRGPDLKNLCEAAQTSLELDACTLDRALSEDPDQDNWDRLCHSIIDPYLAYACLRVSYRPHLRLLMTSGFYYQFYRENGSELREFPAVEGCEREESILSLYCRYSNEAHRAQQDEEMADSTCEGFHDDRLRGECRFYLAISAVMSFSGDPTALNEYLLDYCESINHTLWKSECFFLLADELAQTEGSDVHDIALACEKSADLEPDFLCFDHVANGGGGVFPMGPERTLAFCNAVRGNERYKRECILGLFSEVGTRDFEDMPSVISACLNLSVDYQKYCFRAIGRRVYERLYDADNGDNKRANMPAILELCGRIPQEYEYDCIYGARVRSTEESPGDLGCAEFPPDYIDRCQKHLNLIQEVVGNGLVGWSGSPMLLALPENNSNALLSS